MHGFRQGRKWLEKKCLIYSHYLSVFFSGQNRLLTKDGMSWIKFGCFIVIIIQIYRLVKNSTEVWVRWISYKLVSVLLIVERRVRKGQAKGKAEFSFHGYTVFLGCLCQILNIWKLQAVCSLFFFFLSRILLGCPFWQLPVVTQSNSCGKIRENSTKREKRNLDFEIHH